jgi:hypothetical protein
VIGSRAAPWNARSPFAVIGPAMPSMAPKYIPFERSATWSAAISGSGPLAASAEGTAQAPAASAATAATMTKRRPTGRTTWGPAASLLHFFTNR